MAVIHEMQDRHIRYSEHSTISTIFLGDSSLSSFPSIKGVLWMVQYGADEDRISGLS